MTYGLHLRYIFLLGFYHSLEVYIDFDAHRCVIRLSLRPLLLDIVHPASTFFPINFQSLDLVQTGGFLGKSSDLSVISCATSTTSPAHIALIASASWR